jgi:carbon monoxide dehydrogenase subunit G
MIIEGTYTLQATPEAVCQCLMDEQALWRAIAGVERLERIDEQRICIAIHTSEESLPGSFRGTITITEQLYPYQYALVYEGEEKHTTFSGEGTVHLSEQGENTVVTYKGTLNAGKSRPQQSSALIKGAVKHQLQQFFTTMAEILRTTQPASIDMVEYMQVTTTFEQPGEQLLILPSATEPTLLHALVHSLGLGKGDLLREELWVNRLKLLGTFVGFLFLVWVGTRLPRKQSR